MSAKKLSGYTQQLSGPKCFVKSVVGLVSQNVSGCQSANYRSSCSHYLKILEVCG